MPSTWVAFGGFQEEKPFRAAKLKTHRCMELVEPLAAGIRHFETSWRKKRSTDAGAHP